MTCLIPRGEEVGDPPLALLLRGSNLAQGRLVVGFCPFHLSPEAGCFRRGPPLPGGGDSIGKFWLEFRLEKWIEILF